MLTRGSRTVIQKNHLLKNTRFFSDDFKRIQIFSFQKEEEVEVFDVKTQVSGLGNSGE